MSTAQIIDGKAVATKVLAELKEESAAWTKQTRITPGLVVIIVGNNPASQVYVTNKTRTCNELGWHGETRVLPEDVSQKEIIDIIQSLNADNTVHGVLVQLPLPKHLDEQAILDTITPDKDVDGFHPVNVGRLSLGIPAPVPCTPLGVIRLLQEYQIETKGKLAVIIGRSNIVGKPMAQLLMRKGSGGDATVVIAHSRTANLPDVVRQADIVIAAIGRPQFVKGDYIKEEATVIDVGINRIPAPERPKGTRLVGDVDFETAVTRAGAITPVPGGVGPMTIAMLMRNTLDCAKRLAAKE